MHCRENRDLSQVLDYNNASAVAESNFNASLPVKIIIHGFGSTCLRLWAREMRVSFLAVVSHCSTYNSLATLGLPEQSLAGRGCLSALSVR